MLEAAVVARADKDDLIKPEAWIILKDTAEAADDDRRAELEKSSSTEHVKARASRPYKYPRWYNFVEELPKTATGKIQRFKLRAG